jgi:hypothetical protein
MARELSEKLKAELGQLILEIKSTLNLISEIKSTLNTDNPCIAGTPESEAWLNWATREFMLEGWAGPGDGDCPAAYEGWDYGHQIRGQAKI